MVNLVSCALTICSLGETSDPEALSMLEMSPVLRNLRSVTVGTALDSWFKTAMISLIITNDYRH